MSEGSMVDLVCRPVLSDPAFVEAPASGPGAKSGHAHHAYRGGLAVHTWEVANRALKMASSSTDRSVLLMAAVWHDYSKRLEYRWVPEVLNATTNRLVSAEEIEKTEYYSLIHHVAGSYAEFMVAVNKAQFEAAGYSGPNTQPSAQWVMEVGHCILAHHGRKEWGSPVEPQTEEAYILHAADMWSCQYGPGK